MLTNGVSSIYPGPEYGTFYRVDKDVVASWTSYVTHSRCINGTEQHFLNKALRGEHDPRRLPAWTYPLYEQAKKEGLREATGTIYWNTEVRL
jgi:hypothetical protein